MLLRRGGADLLSAQLVLLVFLGTGCAILCAAGLILVLDATARFWRRVGVLLLVFDLPASVWLYGLAILRGHL
ncbi:hypothetical protein ASE77_18385 [Sphingomonas sp. Leaf226]|nr:hypothetical protein ASE77_18385 [Sphingomonas sp. Leaf226]